MKIITKALYQWRDDGSLMLVSEESYEYSGPVEMARGESVASDQRNKMNSAGDAQSAAAGEIGGFTEPRYKKLADSGYFSPAEEAAATNSVMGGATQPFQTAGFEANNTAARTNNAADLTANQDQLALSEGRTAGEAADQLQNDKMKNQMAGMYGLSGMRSEDLNAMESMYGLGTQATGQYEQAANAPNPWMQLLGAGVGAAGTAIGGYYSNH